MDKKGVKSAIFIKIYKFVKYLPTADEPQKPFLSFVSFTHKITSM